MFWGIACNSYVDKVQGTLPPNSAHWHLSKQQKHAIVELEFPDFFQMKLPSDPLPPAGSRCSLGTQHLTVGPTTSQWFQAKSTGRSPGRREGGSKFKEVILVPLVLLAGDQLFHWKNLFSTDLQEPSLKLTTKKCKRLLLNIYEKDGPRDMDLCHAQNRQRFYIYHPPKILTFSAENRPRLWLKQQNTKICLITGWLIKI